VQIEQQATVISKADERNSVTSEELREKQRIEMQVIPKVDQFHRGHRKK
jgi:hypothetical protein